MARTNGAATSAIDGAFADSDGNEQMMRVMGLDVGERTIGVAVSDPTWLISQGVTTIRRTKIDNDFDELEKLICQNEVGLLVVGRPLHLNGRMSSQARRIDQFVALLAKRFALPIERQDERLSTVAAERALIEGGMSRQGRRGVIDKVAATWFLQLWLDCHRHDRPSE